MQANEKPVISILQSVHYAVVRKARPHYNFATDCYDIAVDFKLQYEADNNSDRKAVTNDSIM